MDWVSAWLQKLGLERYAKVFAENDVDLDAVRLLKEGDLEKLGLSLGHRKRILKAIDELNGAVPPAPQPAIAPAERRGSDPGIAPAVVTTEMGERRQLTVMFCDMVGFTELANRVDPEVLQQIIRSYEDACAICVTTMKATSSRDWAMASSPFSVTHLLTRMKPSGPFVLRWKS